MNQDQICEDASEERLPQLRLDLLPLVFVIQDFQYTSQSFVGLQNFSIELSLLQGQKIHFLQNKFMKILSRKF